MIRYFKNNRGLLIVLLAYLVYGITFILRTSYFVEGIRFFSLFDDAMISMRYARHLAEGYGFVWNIGDKPIEGFTNQFWVVMMAFFHFICHDRTIISLWIQLLGLILLLINLLFVYKIVLLLKPGMKTPALGAIIITGFYLPLNFWSLMGMEVSLITLLTSISVWLTLKHLETGNFKFSQLLVPSLSLLVRQDALLIFMMIFVYCYINFANSRKKILFSGISLIFIIIGGLELFRWMYFGDLLPNTYYLKMTGYPLLLRLGRGMLVTVKYFVYMAPVAIFPIYSSIKNRTRENTLLSCLIIVQIAYSTYTGGDAWDWWGGSNRFISLIIPMFFILTAISLYDFTKGALYQKFKNSRYINLSYTCMILFSLLITNSLEGPATLRDWLLIEKPFAVRDNEACTKIALTVKPFLKNSGSGLVCTAGVISYFLDSKINDMLGKNDRYIARLPMRVSSGLSRFYDFNPGHLKWDYSYSIGVQKPDIIIQLWKEPEKAKPFLDKNYQQVKLKNFNFWFSKESKNIFWEKI